MEIAKKKNAQFKVVKRIILHLYVCVVIDQFANVKKYILVKNRKLNTRKRSVNLEINFMCIKNDLP